MTKNTTLSEVKHTNKSAITAGLALIGMAILAPIAHFGILGTMIAGSNAEIIQNVSSNVGMFSLAIICLLLVIALDFVVAIALYRFFKPTKLFINGFMATSRIIYGLVFAVAVGFLIKAALADSGLASSIPEDIKMFTIVWDAALILFAVHLILLGLLFIKVKNTPTWLAPFLIIAGLGYGIDSIGKFFIEGYSIEVATVAFVGEVILIGWLLIKGRITQARL